MSTPNKTDRFIESFLADGVDQLPYHVYDEVRDQIDHTRQRVVFGPWREDQVSRFAKFALAAAAVVLVAVVGIRFLPTNGGVGVEPLPTATPMATPTPTATATIAELRDGRLTPGVYDLNPLGPANTGANVTVTIPSDSWNGDPEHDGIVWSGQEVEGVGLGLLMVESLNSDACNWATDEDVEVGPTAADLIAVLTRPDNTTGYSPDEPYAEQAGTVTGQGIELTMQAPLPTGCDEDAFRIWNASGFDIYAQGSWNVWRLGVFDADGVRYVVLASYMPDTPAAVRAELFSIFDSVRIEP